MSPITSTVIMPGTPEHLGPEQLAGILKEYFGQDRLEVLQLRKRRQPNFQGTKIWSLSGTARLGEQKREYRLTLKVQADVSQEGHFYRSLATQLGGLTPEVIYVRVQEKHTWIFMEQLPLAKDPFHWEGEDYRRALEAMAQLHALFWDRTEELAAYRWLPRPTMEGSERLSARLAGLLNAMRTPSIPGPVAQLIAGHRLETMERLMKRPELLLQPLNAFGLSLVQGDFSPYDLVRLFPERTVLQDWQTVAVGPPAWEFAYSYNLLGITREQPARYRSSLPIARDQAIGWYLEALKAHGGPVLSTEEFTRAVDCGFLWHVLAYWVPRIVDLAGFLTSSSLVAVLARRPLLFQPMVARAGYAETLRFLADTLRQWDETAARLGLAA